MKRAQMFDFIVLSDNITMIWDENPAQKREGPPEIAKGPSHF